MQPSLEEVRQILTEDSYKVIPFSREILADMNSPIRVLGILKGAGSHCFLLESMEDSRRWGRYSFLGYDPKMELTCEGGKLTINRKTECQIITERPQEKIREILREHRAPRLPGLPSLTGGLIGYFAYDYIQYSEPYLKLDAEDQEHFKDVDLMLFDKIIAFDHLKQKMILIYNLKISPGKTAEALCREAEDQLDAMEALIQKGHVEVPDGRMTSELRPLFGKEAYCAMVERARHFIYEGDIFQVVLSNRLEADFEGSLFNAYRYMRLNNPSPYMFYFSSNDLEIAGASPETLVKLEDGILRTFPLAGTRPRGNSEEEDQRLCRELLLDEKECAEHNMLVDLGRNALGKISRFGSVKVEKYMDVVKYSHVMHIASMVESEIAEGKDALDAIASVLPAGTLSGAPKVRACEIINELEKNRRGIYGGAIGYLDFTGNMDTCIAIRIAFKKNGKVFIRSGAGIVADSVPEKEYQECINKAQAVVSALKKTQGGAAL
ncbi:MAG: anthranilate synthase component I family protein [Candidatus Limivivens sp.]|nr:anthranilate synthase component I family protein [Candidatus Limivivens sp.]